MNWTKHKVPSTFPTVFYRLRGEDGAHLVDVDHHGSRENAGWTVERARSKTDHAHSTPRSEKRRHPMFSKLEDAKIYSELLIRGRFPCPVAPCREEKQISGSSKTIRTPDDTVSHLLARCRCGAAMRLSHGKSPTECGECGRTYSADGTLMERPAPLREA